MKLLQRVIFSQKYTHLFVLQYMVSCLARNTEEAGGGTNMKEDTICCYWISKHMTKQSIQESLHAQITRARLTVCEVGVFQEKYHNSPKYALPSLVGVT